MHSTSLIKFLFFFVCSIFLNACDTNNDIAILASYPKQGACSIDQPERNSLVDKNKGLLIRGWAYDRLNQEVPETLTLYLINETTQKITLATVQRGELRGDVAKAFGNPSLEASGFSGSLPSNKLQAGNYHLILLQINRKSGAIACNGEPHKITVQ